MKVKTSILVGLLVVSIAGAAGAQKEIFWTDGINQLVEKSTIEGAGITPGPYLVKIKNNEWANSVKLIKLGVKP